MTNIFNIPSNYNFFLSLNNWLIDEFGQDIANIKILLPNRRSCRQLQQIFKEKSQITILPEIKAILDINYEDLLEFGEDNEIFQYNILEKDEYLFFLSKEIQKLNVFGDNLEFFQAYKIANSLHKLFDDLEHEEIDLEKIKEIDDSDLSLHRQFSLEFLKSFYVEVKNSLIKKNIAFSNSNKNLILHKYVDLLDKNKLKKPLIIAGSTGSISSSRKLINCVSKLENGYVILNGFKNENYQNEIHAQYFLNKLIENFDNKKIKNIEEKKFLLSNQNRQKFLSLMSLPEEKSTNWQNIDKIINIDESQKDFDNNFQLIEAKNEIEEAKIISLILSKHTSLNSAVITNNNNLANLLKIELNNSNLDYNDTRNRDIFNSPLINLIILILELIENNYDSATLLTILKHPLCYLAKNSKNIAIFERNILRKERKSQDLEGIGKNSTFDEFYSKISKISEHNLASYGDFLIKTVENLTDKTWLELLNKEEAQIEIFNFFEKLEPQKDIKIHPKNALNSFKTLIGQISYFNKSDANAKIQILSPIEARLLNFDLVIISSLNHGDFPEIEAENWLGRKIKQDLGINKNLKKIGQNAYDFYNYLSNRSVILTRSTSKNSAITIESPFLAKFKILSKKAKISLNNGKKYFDELNKFNQISQKLLENSNPKPKKELRHKKISITDISKLLSDPYSIYAKRILKLKELENIDYEGSYAEFGSFVHKALEEYILNDEKDFYKIFKEYFASNEAELIWWPKFENIFKDFIKENEKFKNSKNYLEIPTQITIENIIVRGKIDRVLSDQSKIEIFDYKTGQPSLKTDVLTGSDPQLTIYALMIVEGLIEAELNNVELEDLKSINYWKLSSSSKSEIKKISDDNEELKILISSAKEGLKKLFQYFNNEDNGYIAAPNEDNYKKNEYWHLARIND